MVHLSLVYVCTRAIESLMEEMKADSRLRGSNGGTLASGPPLTTDYQVNVGSHDQGDPNTTNLYVGNLASSVSSRL